MIAGELSDASDDPLTTDHFTAAAAGADNNDYVNHGRPRPIMFTSFVLSRGCLIIRSNVRRISQWVSTWNNTVYLPRDALLYM